jgi:hypothetical protein
MEILNTVLVEGFALTTDQTFNLAEDKFITIKEIFDIDGEIFIAITNHQLPATINIRKTGGQIQTGRFIMPAKQFVLENSHLLS